LYRSSGHPRKRIVVEEHSLCDRGERGPSGEGVRRRMLERREMQM
jgi:hypothetical protein